MARATDDSLTDRQTDRQTKNRKKTDNKHKLKLNRQSDKIEVM